MKEFDYNSRTKYANACIEKWKKANEMKVKALSTKEKAVYEEIRKFGVREIHDLPELMSLWKDYVAKSKDKKNNELKLSEFFRDNLGNVIDIYVPEAYTGNFYDIVDELVTYQYTTGYNRRTLRSNDPAIQLETAYQLIHSYMTFGTYEVTVSQFIKDDITYEQYDYKTKTGIMYGTLNVSMIDLIYAASINAGDKAVIDAITDCFTSENNNVTVTPEIIRAVVKAKNTELHELLCKFLLAAKLQEGLRQAVCENADCGRLDAFVSIIKTIESEKLMRFAAVKRAVATWSGFLDVDNFERDATKAFSIMKDAICDLSVADSLLATDDSINIMAGLWAYGANDVDKAIEKIYEILDNGSKVQKLTASIYNTYIQRTDLQVKVSKKVLEEYSDDIEYVAAYMDTFMSNPSTLARRGFKSKGGFSYYDRNNTEYDYFDIPSSYIFEDDDEAKKYYGILKNIYDGLKKKKNTFDPFVFPWHKVTLEKGHIVEKMAIIAYMLKDNKKIDEICTLLTDIDGQYSQRHVFVRLLLHAPATDVQRKALLGYVADKESMAREAAFSILKRLEIKPEEYRVLEGYLKYKSEDIRNNVLQLIKGQSADELSESVKRMLVHKEENVRLAAFDIIKTSIAEDAATKDSYVLVVKELVDTEKLTEKEKVLYNEIVDEGGSTELVNAEGYGLYNPAKGDFDIPDMPYDIKKVNEYFDVPAEELDRAFKVVTDFILEHGDLEYKTVTGDTHKLSNGLYLLSYNRYLPFHECYPFPELWQELYEKHINSEKLLMNMKVAVSKKNEAKGYENFDTYLDVERRIIPYCGTDYMIPDSRLHSNNSYSSSSLRTVVNIMASLNDIDIPMDICNTISLFLADLKDEEKWYDQIPRIYGYTPPADKPKDNTPITDFMKFETLTRGHCFSNDEEFKEYFYIAAKLDKSFKYQTAKVAPAYMRDSQFNQLSVYDYLKAVQLGIISEDVLYAYIFEGLPLCISVGQLATFSSETVTYDKLQTLSRYMTVDLKTKTFDGNDPYYLLGQKVIKKITDLILDVELKRGDSETIFSKASGKLNRVDGIERLTQILTALGKDTLDRSTYYYWSANNTGKRECLSHLLQVCYPLPSDDVKKLKAEFKAKKISDDRLIEAAMYAPQWLDLAEEYLGCEGFKSCCYYFMAHMNESFSDKKKAMIAKYTPLSPEELNDGCFDSDWFFEAYNKLGDKLFQKLYKAAKYISDGNKHARARKYADAALDKVTRDELESQIIDKRNKDLLMSYGILPDKGEEDELHRYEFLQKFLKESKQFGAQRRASEAKSVEVALKNLATVAGYADDLRLILAMETALVTANNNLFVEKTVGEYVMKIEVGEAGKAELIISKAGKSLKSVPAALKKDETYLELKEFVTKLKNQYSRCVQMFERAMEDREYYSYLELRKLCKNPVIKTILTSLVFIDDNTKDDNNCSVDYSKARIFILESDSEENISAVDVCGNSISMEDDTKFRVAHPYDLYKSGLWSDFQKLFFEKANISGRKQPFKQVFRELYVKLEEELDQNKSRMFAGNQIQPKKTLGTLKSRRWVADYEDGLQKIYYKDNIIATIYALADWFSPADTEEPTLEYVVFYDRKTFKQLKISEVPDIIYSEIMRDTDLAVSVAHAGGVDPITSHSTIEMRKVVCAFNVELFKLSNVTFDGTHAKISGKYGEYTVHLGSGVVHMLGGKMINILPVHSQNRGKIFLPFIDDDPKTAEIMSKIVLLSEDNKIKDPYIMEQIIK